MSLHQSYSQKRINRNPQRSETSPHAHTNNKVFYVNDEVSNTKDIATTFHSPYKNGKRNNEFMNPTFVSSDLFYGPECSRNSLTPTRHNLIFNKNQREKKQLYNKRMQKQDFITNSVHLTVANDIVKRHKTRKVNDETQQRQNLGRSMSRSGFQNYRDDQLNKQLQILIRFREDDERRQTSVSRRLNTTTGCGSNYFKNETPIFHQVNIQAMQKNRDEMQQRTLVQNRKNLKDWMVISDKIKKLRNSANDEVKKKQVKAMDHFILENVNRNQIKENDSRKNASMLANILREQIKQSQAKKAREKRDKQSLN